MEIASRVRIDRGAGNFGVYSRRMVDVLLAYQAVYTRVGRQDSETMFVSSIWQRSGAGWVNVFSQDTPATGLAVP